MATFTLGTGRVKVYVIASGGLLLGSILLLVLNASTSMSPAEAEARVRLYLSREITRQYMQRLNESIAGEPDVEAATEVKEGLGRVRDLEFVSVEVRRLVPDILLRPHRPTHVARVVLRDEGHQLAPRYFWLPWSHIDSEASELAWFFSR